jgi:N-acetylated-alpha-linked acidic dipeptidase
MKPAIFLFAALPLCASVYGESEPLLGFSPEASQSERQAEAEFRAAIEPGNCRRYMERLSARPHHVGSPYDKDNAEWILAQFKEWGWDASIETFDVLFPTPKTRLLEMTEPVPFTASLQEPSIALDPTSGQTDEQLPTYNAYSTDGDVTGPLVYVNYGLPDDYKELARRGISVSNAIVIAKYGQSWRGVKPKVAAEHGAVGCILYSDPRDDGYFVDDVFPAGPMRNSHGVQRGSVMDFPSASPGDPLTPGYGAVPGAKRLSRQEATAITKIPVLPISYGDAQPLLEQLKGPVAPEAWRGALPITYHLGPGPARVHLKLEFNWDIKPVNDIIAKIPGTMPDQWVLRGNHHDAWVNGAEDPISGQVCLLEEARALGRLVQRGWKPRRTIIYCAWDGEEPMLLGSTEWVETHAAELRQHAVAYVNSDGNDRGYLRMEGSHILQRTVNEVAHDIDDPEVKMGVWKRLQAARILAAKDDAERHALRERADLELDALGSGSDYTAFLDFTGVPSLNLSYSGEGDGGIYHSVYDDFYWYTHFSDTNFVYARALAQTIGTTVMRMADAEVIPYEFTGLSGIVQKYTDDLQKLLKQKRESLEERRREMDDGVFTATSDPQRPLLAPEAEAVPPELNFAPLLNAANDLKASAEKYQKAFAAARAKFGDPAQAGSIDAVNQILIQAEHKLTDPDGLPRRPWYKHLLYAPGIYSGYGAKTMPGAREGIELGHYDEAEKEMARIAQAVESEKDLIDSAAKALEAMGK